MYYYYLQRVYPAIEYSAFPRCLIRNSGQAKCDSRCGGPPGSWNMMSAWSICLGSGLNSQFPCLSPQLPPRPMFCIEPSLLGCVPSASVSSPRSPECQSSPHISCDLWRLMSWVYTYSTSWSHMDARHLESLVVIHHSLGWTSKFGFLEWSLNLLCIWTTMTHTACPDLAEWPLSPGQCSYPNDNPSPRKRSVIHTSSPPPLLSCPPPSSMPCSGSHSNRNT